VPSSIKLKAELGDDLNILFVESQQTSPEDTEAFIYKYRWAGSEALWTNEAPCSSGINTLPSYVLLDNEGRALVTGYVSESKIKELVAAEIKSAKSAPKDLAPALAKAMQEFNKGAYSAAILAANKLASEGKPETLESAKALAESWTAQAAARIGRLKYLIDKEQFAKADDEVDALRSSLKGLPELEAKLAPFSAQLSSDELKLPREAAKALAGVLKKVYDKGVDDQSLKGLKKVAEKYPGTRSGEEAGRLLRLLDKM
jgi:hypothetical protein